MEESQMPEKETLAEEVSAEEAEALEAAEAERGEEVDELTALRSELEEVKAQAAEYLDGWQRARAEFANYRRRQEQERKELHKLANAALMRRLLPILDDFERAFATLPPALLSLSWIDGIALIHRRLEAALQAEGLTPIEVQPGESFDPLLHEAITHEAHEDFEEGQVIAEVQRGYKLGDRMLRPTLVRVSSGPPEKEAAEKTAEETEGETKA